MEFHQIARVRKLYKTILKLHKGLPPTLKTIGDVYVRDEFKKHKSCKPQEEAVFVEEWTKYAILLTQQLGVKGPINAKCIGRNLTRGQLDSMSDDQIQRLYEVMLATQEGAEEESTK
ncbi:UNVERIFIED_CONTAM: hypothetical protein PYX00_009866 [Menopon gallinae]|uniref:Succinate dehydrogenase assembly factor 3 n=1 Tax=Menopon gallinae TaxID=328185 RepID=A0AAW2HDS2_9NEOP